MRPPRSTISDGPVARGGLAFGRELVDHVGLQDRLGAPPLVRQRGPGAPAVRRRCAQPAARRRRRLRVQASRRMEPGRCLHGTHLVVMGGSQTFHAVAQLLRGEVDRPGQQPVNLYARGEEGAIVDVVWRRAPWAEAGSGNISSRVVAHARLALKETVSSVDPAGAVARLTFLPSRFPADALKWLGMGVLLPHSSARADQLGGESGPVPLRAALFVDSHAVWYKNCAISAKISAKCPRVDLGAIREAHKPPSQIKKNRSFHWMRLQASALAETYMRDFGVLVRELERICRADRVFCLVGQMPITSKAEQTGLPAKLRSAANALVRPLAGSGLLHVVDMYALTMLLENESVKGHWSNAANAWAASYMLAPLCAAAPAAAWPPAEAEQSGGRVTFSPACFGKSHVCELVNKGECWRRVVVQRCNFVRAARPGCKI
mmetsp:Transcript_23770/g.54974  ORF Transcript_23770/g.54974 Transcript_23770/m.54974 type:complete len:433 (+) Transcript_23770:680-1978(+)